jgi:hypothetical protein
MLRVSANQTKTRGALPIKLLINANHVKAETAFDHGDMLKNSVCNIGRYCTLKRVITIVEALLTRSATFKLFPVWNKFFKFTARTPGYSGGKR